MNGMRTVRLIDIRGNSDWGLIAITNGAEERYAWVRACKWCASSALYSLNKLSGKERLGSTYDVPVRLA